MNQNPILVHCAVHEDLVLSTTAPFPEMYWFASCDISMGPCPRSGTSGVEPGAMRARPAGLCRFAVSRNSRPKPSHVEVSMRAGGALPDRDLPVRVELVHESGRTRVTRLFLDGRTIIRKEPLGPDADRRLRHERAILERLRGVAGVAQLVETPQYPNSIMIADGGGTSLAGPEKPLGIDELIGLAPALARAVADMHRRGVVHRRGHHRACRAPAGARPARSPAMMRLSPRRSSRGPRVRPGPPAASTPRRGRARDVRCRAVHRVARRFPG